MKQHLKNTVILYHADCPDGFGAAFAAWKKFKEEASYVPVRHNQPPPEGLEGKEVYIADFSYPNGTVLDMEKQAKRLVVLDHHLGAKADVEAVKEHVFDETRSGATIAWNYFHPNTDTPRLLQYVQDGDLYTFNLPDARAVLAYVYTKPFAFETWNTLMQELETEDGKRRMVEIGTVYREHFALLVEKIARQAKLVEFEGFECYFASAPEMFASDVGHYLSDKKPPIALIVRAEKDRIAVSLRSDGTVNVADLAKKYGGGGHPAAAGFRVPYGKPVPWQPLES